MAAATLIATFMMGMFYNGIGFERMNVVQADGVLNKTMSVIASGNSSFAIDEQNRLWAWGDNESGQLGDGTTDVKSSPVKRFLTLI